MSTKAASSSRAGTTGLATLGVLVWWQITGEDGDLLPITREEIAASFSELGIDEQFLPTPPKAIDTFRAASSALDGYEYDIQGHRIRITCAERPTEDTEYVIRQLVRTVIAASQPTATKVAELRFYRPTRISAGRVRGTEAVRTFVKPGLPEAERPIIQELLDRFQRSYDGAMARLTTTALRRIVRDVLINSNAITVKKASGIYFIHNAEAPTVDALARLVERAGPGCYLHTVPLLDDPVQRDMLARAFEEQVLDDVRALLNDIETWLRSNAGRAMTLQRTEIYRSRFQTLTAYAMEQAARLDIPQVRTAEALEEAYEVIANLKQYTKVAN